MLGKLQRLLAYGKQVTDETGKPLTQQLSELLDLRFSGNHLGFEEYYRLGIFNDKHFPPAIKKQYLGWRGSHHLDAVLNDSASGILADDKIINYSLLNNLGFPIPKTVATFSRVGRKISDETLLTNENDLTTFLTTASHYPLFAKPVFGAYGRGTFALTNYDSSRKAFDNPQSQFLSLGEVTRHATDPFSRGYLFQEKIRQHPEVETVVGDTVSCLRIIVVLTSHGPKLRLAFWKIARASNITDNFSMGASGNLLGKIDSVDGTITRVVNGFWPEGSDVLIHPDTKKPLLGMRLPHWQKVISTCLEAAPQFTGIRVQGWDVALCEDHPVLVELNTHADLEVPEFLHHTTFIDNDVAQALTEAQIRRSEVARRMRRERFAALAEVIGNR